MMQAILNSLILTAELGLITIGLTNSFAIARFANISHASLVLWGTYIAFALSVQFKLNLVLAIIIALLGAGLLAIALDMAVFKRLRERGAGGLILLVSSFALMILLRNLLKIIWGPGTHSFPSVLQKTYVIIGGGHITQFQILIIGVSFASMYGFHLLLTRTKLGRSMRAISDNEKLAQACGIHKEAIMNWVWLLAGILAALGGIFLGYTQQIHPRIGFNIILPAFAAAIAGGIGNPYGAMLGAALIAFSQNILLSIDWGGILSFLGLYLGSLYINPSYKYAISFIVMIIVLLIRPSGILRGRVGD
ncbi:hypothetical protein AKJ61_00530 [candidate division MSBL1 archaeon SCGC-AAA259B11]|uniref:Branched-chain amino acid ABC transporter permease n=1 Tax=candidate division MSBL1 archaeon SCGC-AAA259B11 TaxID=1698260 RepID=A0A133U8F3_9EURY|nr:hypothetical protein AKJ61_00530 [candidate division MSBL1 archaeon SCGC-AAA259B11]